jgi:hypothetical protein
MRSRYGGFEVVGINGHGFVGGYVSVDISVLLCLQ